jgi:hypothetical protein
MLEKVCFKRLFQYNHLIKRNLIKKRPLDKGHENDMDEIALSYPAPQHCN